MRRNREGWEDGYPNWVRRFWFWSSDASWRYTMDEKLPSKLVDFIDTWWDRLVTDPFQWLVCRVWGHLPIAMCHNPAHDYCAICTKPTPNQGPRKGKTSP